MRNILGESRDITIGGVVVRFRDHAYLADGIEIEIETIQQAEAELDINPGEAPKIWTYIASRADYLGVLLAAQEQWLADHDAIVAREVDELRTAIRKLSFSSYKGGKEGIT